MPPEASPVLDALYALYLAHGPYIHHTLPGNRNSLVVCSSCGMNRWTKDHAGPPGVRHTRLCSIPQAERALHAAGYALPHVHPETLKETSAGPMPTGVTVYLTVTLPALPGVTSEALEGALTGVLGDLPFTVQPGAVPSPAPTTPRELGREASRLLTAAHALRPYEAALQGLGTLLHEQARTYRLQGCAADPREAERGWEDDPGHTLHGRLRAD